MVGTLETAMAQPFRNGTIQNQTQNVWISKVQWGSEIEHLKSGLIEGSISNGRAFALATALVPTI